jgi:hypothetical protein
MQPVVLRTSQNYAQKCQVIGRRLDPRFTSWRKNSLGLYFGMQVLASRKAQDGVVSLPATTLAG